MPSERRKARVSLLLVRMRGERLHMDPPTPAPCASAFTTFTRPHGPLAMQSARTTADLVERRMTRPV